MATIETESGLVKDFCMGLTSSSAALITLLIGIYTFSGRNSGLSVGIVLAASVSYLIALVAGIIAFMALISSVHHNISPYENNSVKIWAGLQLATFVLGAIITIYAIYSISQLVT